MYQTLKKYSVGSMLNRFDDDVDSARGGSPPRPANAGISRDTIQADIIRQTLRRLRQWGFDPGGQRNRRLSTLRVHQPQVVPNLSRSQRRPGREITAPNQPDIQAVDPRTGRRVNIEVEVPRNHREREDAIRQFHRVIVNDPRARSILLIHDAQGRAVEKHVYNPDRYRLSQAGNLIQQGVRVERVNLQLRSQDVRDFKA